VLTVLYGAQRKVRWRCMWTDNGFSRALSPRGLLAALALGALGCGPHFQNRAPDTEIVPNRTVVLPPIVSAYRLDAFDKLQADRKRAKMLVDVFVPEIERQRRLRGLNLFPREKIKECGEPCLEELKSLMEWGADASLEIAAKMGGRTDFNRDSVVDWEAWRSYDRLRNAMSADFVLIVRVSDTSSTGGRLLLSALAGMHTSWTQIVSVCVADLHHGRMVWCDSKVDGSGLLTDPENVQAIFSELLSGFESNPQSSARR
jgi:hypothetical protein